MLTGTVTADFNRADGDGSPAAGTVTFRPSVRLVHAADGDIIVNSPVTVALVAGLLDVDLPATDDPQLEPAGWTWHVTEHVNGIKRGYSMYLLAGSTVDLSTVAPVDPVSPAATYVSASTAITAAALREIVEDIVGALAVDGALVDFTYDDATGALTATVIGLTSANLSDFAEAVRDRLGSTLVAGPNVTVTVDDPGDTVTIGLTGVATTAAVAQALSDLSATLTTQIGTLGVALTDEAAARLAADAAEATARSAADTALIAGLSSVGVPAGGFRRLSNSAVADRTGASRALRNPRLFITGSGASRTFYVFHDETAGTGDTATSSVGVSLSSGSSLTALAYQGVVISGTEANIVADVGDANPYVQAGGVVYSGGTYHTFVCATNAFDSSLSGGGIYHFTAPAPAGPWTYADKPIGPVSGERAPLDNSTPVWWNGKWLMAFMSYKTSYPTRNVVLAEADSLSGPWTRRGTDPTARGGYPLTADGPELFIDNDKLWLIMATAADYNDVLYDLTDMTNAFYYGSVLQLGAGQSVNTAENGSVAWGRGGVYRVDDEMFFVWQARATGASTQYKVFAGQWALGRPYVTHASAYFVNASSISGTGTKNLPSAVPMEAFLVDLHVEVKETGTVTPGEYVAIDDGYTNYPSVLYPAVQNVPVSQRCVIPCRIGATNRTIRYTCSGTSSVTLSLTVVGYWRLP